jgi:SAM-dependent methyltransferase
MSERDWSATFESTFAAPMSRVELEVWREVFGDEYPDGLDPHSYISRTELVQFVTAVRVGEGQRLADVGCGRGGAGLWVAAHTGAGLVGVDIAESALSAARHRAAALGLADRASYVVGSFESLPLPDASVDAVMSVDALLFTPDKAAAARELARVLRPGGRLVVTSWDYSSQPVGRPPQVADHRPLFEAAGLRVLAYDETEDWRGRQARIDEALFARIDEWAAELGEDPEELRAALAEMHATTACMTRRFLAVAERS